MNILRDARKRLFEHRWYDGKFGAHKNADDYIADQLNRWNSAPPTRVTFCKQCGSAIKWFREASSFSVSTGAAGHAYHLKCPHAHDIQYELDRQIAAGETRLSGQMAVIQSDMHHDSHEYRWREDDRESFEFEDLW